MPDRRRRLAAFARLAMSGPESVAGVVAGGHPRARVREGGRPGSAIAAALERIRARAGAIPAPAWLATLVVVSAVNLLAFGSRVSSPWILPDELIYTEIARSLGESGAFRIRDVGTAPFSILYPLLLAPVYALAPGLVTAYGAAKALNAVLFSLAAVPAYLLARQLLSRGWSLVAAGLAVAVPSAAYAGVVMTENAFYPLFLTFAVVLTRALERPTTARQLGMLALVVVAFGTRAQAVALVPAIVTSIGLVALLESRRSPTGRMRAAVVELRRYRTTWLGLTVGLALVLAAQTLRGGGVIDVLGPYAAAVGSYSPWESARSFAYHVAELDLYLGVAPFAAFLVATWAALTRATASRRLRAFAVAAVAVSVWMTLLVAVTSSRHPEGYPALPPRVHERYLFYVAPLLLTLALFWIADGMRRPRRVALGAAAGSALLPAVLPVAELGHVGSESLALLPWRDLGSPNVWILGAGVAVGALFLLLPRRLAVVLPLLLLMNFLFIRSLAQGTAESVSRWVLATGITVERDWIDRRVGKDAEVVVLWDGTGAGAASDHVGEGHRRSFRRLRAVWLNEAFNESVGRVYHVGSPMLYNLPSEPLALDTRTGSLRSVAGTAFRASHVLAHGSTGVLGRPVAEDPGTGMVVYRVDGSIRLRSSAR